jgi:hypothetical protein
MANLSIGDFSSQIALSCNYNYSNGGLGMANGQSSAIDDGLSNIFIACAGTVGYDEAPEIQQNLFNYFSTSTLNNENRFSLTYAPSLIFSNDDRDQQNATIAFRVGRVSMFVMEDSGSFGLTDGEDRWWTGSGGLNVDLRGLGNNGLTTFMINSDTYTGNSYNKDYLINDYEYGGFSGNNDYFWANQEDFDPIGNSGYNRSLNMAQTRISLVTSDNTTYSFSQTGPNHFMAQNVIHDFLCFHHFKPATDNANNLFSITMGN